MSKKSFLPLLLLGAIILAGISLTFWWNIQLSAVNKENKNTQVFVVEKGSGLKQIASDLKNAGLIRSPFVFTIYAKQQQLDSKIQAGDFRLSPSYPVSQIVSVMTKGTLDVWITIPEGKRADEIADILSESIPTYTEEWRDELNKHEGYLFPDTYLIPRYATIEMIVSLLTNTFTTRYAQATETKTSTYSQAEIVNIAAMVEREAKYPEDRPKIASVIENRLRIGMALQIDATVQYIVGNSTKWWPTLRESPKNISPNSPYNTYTHPGLPPTPISNPGVAALTAAANPDRTNYLYYYTDSSGVTHFSTNYEDHQANIAKYR